MLFAEAATFNSPSALRPTGHGSSVTAALLHAAAPGGGAARSASIPFSNCRSLQGLIISRAVLGQRMSSSPQPLEDMREVLNTPPSRLFTSSVRETEQ